uniref:Putative transporter C11D3.18C n=1 Tax=Talaromyces marneffei PM1 TaxID=1077442 RepID=A0A093V3W3_TALMA
MREERHRSLNAIVTCVNCRLSLLLTNVSSHEGFEVITSATDEYTLYIPINTVCLNCFHTVNTTPVPRVDFTGAKDVANALFLEDDVNPTEDISLTIYEFPYIIRPETEIVELKVQVEQPTERGRKDLVVTKTPYVTGDVLLRIYDRDRDIEIIHTNAETDVREPVDIPQLTTTTKPKLMAKIDLHILPFLLVLYLMAFLDRVNISNALLFGLEQDLDIQSGTKYNTALMIFFVPYVIFEPHVWLSLCMGMFGFAMVMQGLVQNWSGLMATRFFLGLFESGIEAQRRFSFFFGSATLAGAFSGVLAYAIGLMDGIRGVQGWRWLFILEGLLTIVFSILCFWMLPDFPETVHWLTEEERKFIQAKLEKDTGKSAHGQGITWRDVLDVLKDYKILVGGLAYFGLIVPSYALTTQLYSVPPWAAAFIFSQVVAYFSDKLRHRFLFIIASICITTIGLVILLSIRDKRHVEYGALFLVTSGTFSAMPMVLCWFAMNLGGHKRRSVGTAYQIGFGNIGGIIATYSFLSQEAPNFRTGFLICVSFTCLSAIACAVYLLEIRHANHQRDRNNAVLNEAENLGDLAITYRYLY